jgi:hypothetical protein
MSSTGIDDGASIQNQRERYFCAMTEREVTHSPSSMYAVLKLRTRSHRNRIDMVASTTHTAPSASTRKQMRIGTTTAEYRMHSMTSRSHLVFDVSLMSQWSFGKAASAPESFELSSCRRLYSGADELFMNMDASEPTASSACGIENLADFAGATSLF